MTSTQTFTLWAIALVIFFGAQSFESQTPIPTTPPPKSKGCIYPTREIHYLRTEMRPIIPVSQIHKCFYDINHRLIRRSTYNFEHGYQLKKPTDEVIYEWDRDRLKSYSTRRATHGNGEVDFEVFNLR
jgi:hypothetical protein